jgi:transcription elongation factor Elf1
MRLEKVKCSVCDSSDVEFVDVKSWKSLIACNECGFEFRLEPMPKDEFETDVDRYGNVVIKKEDT